MEKLNLKYKHTWSGHCQVYYAANRRLYCMQLQRPGLFHLLSCSHDGEPCCPIKPEAIGAIEPSKGDERIDQDLNEFLASNPRINEEYAR